MDVVDSTTTRFTMSRPSRRALMCAMRTSSAHASSMNMKPATFTTCPRLRMRTMLRMRSARPRFPPPLLPSRPRRCRPCRPGLLRRPTRLRWAWWWASWSACSRAAAWRREAWSSIVVAQLPHRAPGWGRRRNLAASSSRSPTLRAPSRAPPAIQQDHTVVDLKSVTDRETNPPTHTHSPNSFFSRGARSTGSPTRCGRASSASR